MNVYDTYAQRAQHATVHAGSTSYFSVPDHGLDPSLFDKNNAILPNVRTFVLATLYHFWDRQFRNPHAWSTVWIAGSGASYQWSAARQPGDLDVLIGVNFYEFRSSNPEYAGLSDAEISDFMDDQFRNTLDKHTDNQHLNGSFYEVTFYVNPGSADIRNIMPYAAYDLTHNTWTVHPDPDPIAPDNKDFKARATADRIRANEIIREYNRAYKASKRYRVDPAHQLNAESWLKHATEQGAALFDEIHQGRHVAFRSGGTGYADWANYRWQAGKSSGIVPALQQMKAQKNDHMAALETQLYGAAIPDAEHALVKAALWRAGQ